MILNYRVRARNTASDSENKIHDDATAAKFGFQGGLVPGVTVYAYMTVPIVDRFGLRWLERGSMQIKFHQPFYDGEEVFVQGELDESAETVRIALTAAREDETVCATALATLDDRSAWLGQARAEDYLEVPLPADEDRPALSPQLLIPGAALGTLTERLSVPDTNLLEALDERLPIYRGERAVAHPYTLLALANQILVRNYKLGPWIHAASDLINWSAMRDGERVSVRGQIRESFERKGHEFVVLDVLVLADDNRIVQQVRHTAIYRPRSRNTGQ